MGDQPGAEALLVAMAGTLAEEVVPAASGRAQHSARVVANLCRILARELASDDADEIDGAVGALLRRAVDDGPLSSRALMQALDDRLREGDEEFARRAVPIMRLDVERRLAISKPSYLHADRTGRTGQTETA